MLRLSADLLLLNEYFMEEAQHSMAQAYLAEAKKHWVREEDPEGRPWPRRKPPTGSWPVLEKTGKLQETAKVAFHPRRGFTAKVAPYGKWHQYGTSRMPARPLFGINSELLYIFRKIIWRKILKVQRLRVR